MTNRSLFFQHLAQTSPEPIGIEMKSAEGIYLYDINNKKYIDGISGFSVANIGHSNPNVIKAVEEQSKQYMHLIVYGEFIQQPQVQYAKLLADNLPESLNSVYFTNSGAEATEGAMKLAKRATGRSKILCFNKSYHGSTQGALSVMGDEYFRNAFRPLLPEVYHFNYNDNDILNEIDDTVACVIIEIVQAESGINAAKKEWLKALHSKCLENGVLLIADEIQSGFGRTGSLWAFEQYEIVPDILLLGKALGGGMPLGAFIADKKIMNLLTADPVLGHITTFGGHPVSCAAGKAALEFLINEKLIGTIKQKEQILKDKLVHPKILGRNICGLWASIAFDSFETNKKVAHNCIKNGVITDWFLFAPERLRIAPPLIITNEELELMCDIIIQSID